jgi:hypothetical protein
LEKTAIQNAIPTAAAKIALPHLLAVGCDLQHTAKARVRGNM